MGGGHHAPPKPGVGRKDQSTELATDCFNFHCCCELSVL